MNLISKMLQYSVLLLLITGCATERISPPPQGDLYHLPFGAVSVEYHDDSQTNIISRNTVENYITEYRRQHPGEKIPYRLLALSGGGARGAYGAGILAGWTANGSRPEFDVVTGISTGALMATAVFLGSQYDDLLRIYTDVDNEDIYMNNGKLSLLTKESLYDTAPLRELLVESIDEPLLEEVARQNALGRHLFIGTTNLDANLFTIWDMGKIAASDRPNKLQLYRDVVLASASFPMAFPPVYLPTEGEKGHVHLEMHVDGGVRESVFLFDFLGEYEELFQQLNLDFDRDVDMQIYMLYNGKLNTGGTYDVVAPNFLSIAMNSMQSLMRKNVVSSIFDIWISGLTLGATVHTAHIPKELDISANLLDFNRQQMNDLYHYGYQQSLDGTAWRVQRPPKSLEELEQLLEFYTTMDPLNPSSHETEPASSDPGDSGQ